MLDCGCAVAVTQLVNNMKNLGLPYICICNESLALGVEISPAILKVHIINKYI